MFDIEAVKREIGIADSNSKKTDFEACPGAIPAIRAIPRAENSMNSTNSTPPPLKSEFFRHERKACFWLYKLDTSKPGFIQMGLMTDDPSQAQKQLAAIYGKPVHDLHMEEKDR